MTPTPLPPLDWVSMLKDAIGIVKGKPHYKRLIDGTPLSNDVPVWMADFAMQHAAQARADLEAENKRLLDTIDAIYIYANDTLSGRTDGPDDREWQRAAVVEIRNRARKHATVDSAVFARADLEAENKRLREALEFVARHKSSDWPERCQQMVNVARNALKDQP